MAPVFYTNIPLWLYYFQLLLLAVRRGKGELSVPGSKHTSDSRSGLC